MKIPRPFQPPVKIPSQYQKLEKLLADGKWKEADEETRGLILTLANRGVPGYLDIDSVLYLPSEDISIIDNLWVKNSNGRFGFSVQKQIYESVGGTTTYNHQIWNKFIDQVGWRKGKNLLSYNEITFDTKAPKAHLPFFPVGWIWWWKVVISLYSQDDYWKAVVIVLILRS